MKRVWFIIVLNISKLGLCVCKLFHKQGSVITGTLALKLQKCFIKYFKNIDYDKTIFITGTNGKSTNTNLIAHLLKTANKSIATNLEGANMMSGVATTLIKNSNHLGYFNKEYLVLEIDERSLANIHKYLKAHVICISNLFKDQVQRNGDPDFIFEKFKNTIDKDVTLFLNNEEPRSRALEDYAKKSIYYGIEKNPKTFIKKDFYNVTMPCPKCSHRITYLNYNIENIGPFKCTNCNYKSLDKIDYKICDINYELSTCKCNNKTYSIPYINPYYLYNYALSIALLSYYKIDSKTINEGLKIFINPANRTEYIKYKDKTIHYLRIKQENPETLQNALDIVSRDSSSKAIWIGLYEVKDFTPHYTNTFYFFDCDFEKVVSNNVEKYVSFSKTVAYDAANRMLYAGIPEDKLKVYDIEDDFKTIFEDLDKLKTNNIYLITGMKPYKKIKAYFKED